MRGLCSIVLCICIQLLAPTQHALAAEGSSEAYANAEQLVMSLADNDFDKRTAASSALVKVMNAYPDIHWQKWINEKANSATEPEQRQQLLKIPFLLAQSRFKQAPNEFFKEWVGEYYEAINIDGREVRHGKYSRWNILGNLDDEGYYHFGKRVGHWVMWSGWSRFEIVYDDGKQIACNEIIVWPESLLFRHDNDAATQHLRKANESKSAESRQRHLALCLCRQPSEEVKREAMEGLQKELTSEAQIELLASASSQICPTLPDAETWLKSSKLDFEEPVDNKKK